MNGWTADISLWQFPASLILGTAFLLGVWALHRYGRQTHFYHFLSSSTVTIVLLVLTALILVAEGTWALGLYRTYPFIGLILLLTASLGLVVLRRLPKHDWGFLLNHAGLFILLWGALFGSPDATQSRMVVHTGETSHLSYTPQGEIIPLPFDVQLDRFTVVYYDDSTTPRQFRSELTVGGKTYTAEVNTPVRYKGYTIYQDSYDRRHGAYTVLLITRDPWLGVVWLGAAMLAAGSFILLFRKR